MTIDIALVSAPGVLGDLLERVIETDPGVRLAVRCTELDSAIAESSTDVIIWCGEEPAAPAVARDVLEAGGCDGLLSISADGRRATLHRPRRDPLILVDPSPAGLLDVIRTAAA